MKKKSPIQAERRWDAGALDELIDEFTVEAAGDDERILAFLKALWRSTLPYPATASSSASRSQWSSSTIRGTSGAG